MLRDKEKGVEMTYSYKVSNRGPSAINNLVIKLLIPRFYKHEGNNNFEIIKFKEISCTYKRQSYDVNLNSKEAEASISDSINERVKRGLIKKNKESKAQLFQGDDLDDSFKNRTIMVNCRENTVECLEAEVTVQNFENSKELIFIDINFMMKIQEIGK